MLKIRNARLSDRAALVDFSDRLDRRNVSTFDEDFFTWQFDDAAKLCNTDDNGALIGVDNDRIVSLAYGNKVSVFLAGQTTTGLWQQAWFSEPSYSGAGLFVMREQMQRNPFVGASGQNYSAASINERLRRMNWFQLRRLFIVLDVDECANLAYTMSEHAKRFVGLTTAVSPSKRCDVRRVTRFDDAYDACWLEFREPLLLASDRTSAYMNWRYLEHPRFTYQCLEIRAPSGNAYYVWREESVSGNLGVVARICEVIGKPEAIIEGFGHLFRILKEQGVAFADFFCSHGVTNAALMASGMREVITTEELDLPRLFQPITQDERKTLNFYYSFDEETQPHNFYNDYRTYITKGDGNQDRPNP